MSGSGQPELSTCTIVKQAHIALLLFSLLMCSLSELRGLPQPSHKQYDGGIHTDNKYYLHAVPCAHVEMCSRHIEQARTTGSA